MVNDRQSLDLTTFARAGDGCAVEWLISGGSVSYPEAVAEMEARAAAIAEGKAAELVWLLEHPPLYTSGTSGKQTDLLDPRFPLFTTGRGGQLTYHGPGQRVAYVMLDLKRRRPDVRAYVAGLEEWIIRTLDAFNVAGAPGLRFFSFTIHLPFFAVADAFCSRNSTVTRSPSSAQPQIGTVVFCCNTMWSANKL